MALNTQPPAWLESLSARPYEGLNQLGQLAGRYLGAGAATLTGTNDPTIDNQDAMGRFRSNLANTYKQDRDPMWRLHEMMAQQQYQQGLAHAQSLYLQNQIRMQTLQQTSGSEKEMYDWGQQVQAKGGGPQAMLDTPYVGSNPKTSKLVNDAQLNASRALVQSRLNTDKVRINKLVDGLTAPDRSQFLQMPRGDDGMPTPEGWAFLNEASQRAQKTKDWRMNLARSPVGKLYQDRAAAQARGEDVTAFDEAIAKQTGDSQNFKNLPMAAQMYERLKHYQEAGDERGAEVMENALAAYKAKDLGKTDHALLTDALTRQRQANKALQDPKTYADENSLNSAKAAKSKAEADVANLLSKQNTPAATGNAPSQTAPAQKPSGNVNFIFKDGALVPQ